MNNIAIQGVARDWRWLPGVILAGYVLLIAGTSWVAHVSPRQLLQGLGVPALEYPLMDLRGVAAWCDAWSEGKDPSVVPTSLALPGETERHPNFLMNYSPLVLGFGNIGLSGKSVLLWGAGLACLYGAALWFLCGPCTLWQAFLWALLFCSPASVLVVERGNLDMLLFAFLVSALKLRKYPLAESGVILGASLIKFFPVVSLFAPWRDGRRGGRPSVILALIAFGIFLFFLRARLSAIGGSLENQYQSAFGYSVPLELMVHYGIMKGSGVSLFSEGFRLFALIGICASCLTGFFLCRRADDRSISESSLHAFYLGAPLVLALFVQGPQMDYKWIFFLLMVPAVIELTRSASNMESEFAKIWLCMVTAYSYWTFFSDEGSLRNAFLKQLLMWGAIFFTAFLAGALWNRRSTS